MRACGVATEDDQQVTVPVEWAGRHLDHGYAMTWHKALGATVETALLYGAGALTREAGYVALSRGRAALLAVRRSQTLATRQLPSTGTNRWRSSISHEPMHRRAEGRSL